jgi:hypothetical protein
MGVTCNTLDQNHKGIQHGQQTLDLRRPMHGSEDSSGINLWRIRLSWSEIKIDYEPCEHCIKPSCSTKYGNFLTRRIIITLSKKFTYRYMDIRTYVCWLYSSSQLFSFNKTPICHSRINTERYHTLGVTTQNLRFATAFALLRGNIVPW